MSLIFNNKQLRYPLSGSFTGSFSGSFTGDGSQLTGIISSKWSGSNPITRNSNVEITGSLSVTEGITGSFSGSGAGLFDIPASSIIGLNLNQISSGSVSASISPNNGLQVNTNITATSFTGSLFGTSSVAINADSASYVLNAISSSYTSTASYVDQLNQDVNISGSLTVTAGITGSLLGTSSFATTASFATSTNAIISLNLVTGSIQTFVTGTTGTDFNISSSETTHTFNLPTASDVNRGALSSLHWSKFTNSSNLFNYFNFI